MSALGNRIRDVLGSRGLSQADLARMVGCKQQTISYLIKTTTRDGASRYTTRIAEALGVNPGWLATGDGEPGDPTVPVSVDGKVTKASRIPLLSQAAALRFIRSEPVEELGNLIVEHDQPGCFAIEVEGDSMAPRFQAGDRVILNQHIPPIPGDYVLASLGDGLLFRRYRTRETGFELVPENSDWASVHQSVGVRIIATMVEHRTYRKKL